MGLHSVACCLLEGGSPSCLPDSHHAWLRPPGDFYLKKARLDFFTQVKDNRGNTPLMIAILSGNLDAVKVVNIMFAAVQFCHTSHDAHTMYPVHTQRFNGCFSFQSLGDGGRPQSGSQDEERQRTKSGDCCEGGLLVSLQEAQSFGGFYPEAKEG